MKTQVLAAGEDAFRQAAGLLRAGKLVGIPTETVYGLAADALNPQAVLDIFAAKGRPADNPLIVHICDLAQMEQLANPPALAYELANAFWPGPLTMTLPRKSIVPDCVTASLPTVGIRMPSHPAAAAIIRLSGPLAAPSGNRSGSPSPTNAGDMLADMDGRIPLIVDGGSCGVGVESTVILVQEDRVRLLRPGGVTVDQLRQFCPVEVDDGVLHQLAPDARAASPGMKYRHYAPKASVILVEGSTDAFRDYLVSVQEEGCFALAPEEECSLLPCPAVPLGRKGDDLSQAQALFAALRECDRRGAKTVYARAPHRDGVGLAVYNRLLRAAGFQVVKL